MIIKITNKDQNSLIATGKYKLHYEIGKVTESLPNTLGVFCYIPEGIEYHKLYIDPLSKIYEVEGIGESKKKVVAFNVSLICDKNLDIFYTIEEPKNCSFRTSSDVVCYPAVKVLREISMGEFRDACKAP